jgi:thiol-disulfide isomerase/thioredoxin
MKNLQNNKFICLLLLCSILSSIFLLSGCVTEEVNQQTILNDFTFTTVEGKTKHLSDYLGKVVLLDLWAIWCQPCQIQMIQLYEAYSHYPSDEFEILSINIDSRETINDIQDFLGEYEKIGYSLDWVFGTDDDGDIWERYKVGREGIPALVIFDKTGELVFAHEGFMFFSELPEGVPPDMDLLAPILDEYL